MTSSSVRATCSSGTRLLVYFLTYQCLIGGPETEWVLSRSASGTLAHCLIWRLVWAQEHCRTHPPCFLAKCRKKWLNQGSFVLLCFRVVCFSRLCSVSVLSVFLICLLGCIFQSSVNQHEWHCMYSLILCRCAVKNLLTHTLPDMAVWLCSETF